MKEWKVYEEGDEDDAKIILADSSINAAEFFVESECECDDGDTVTVFVSASGSETEREFDVVVRKTVECSATERLRK